MMRIDGSARQSSIRLPVNPRRHKVAPGDRKRVATACNACNVRRVKCSGEQPCGQCCSASRECIYPRTIEKVSISRGELEDLKRKVALYERALQDAVPDPSTGHEFFQRAALSPEESNQASAISVASHPQSSQPVQPRSSQHRATDQGDDVQVSTEGRLLNDPDGHARFLGETSGATFLDHLKEFMRTVLPLANHDQYASTGGSTFLLSLGSYQTYDSRPLHERDVDPIWLPPKVEMEAMLSELRYFVQDGNGNWPSGGIYWWGVLHSVSPDHLDPKPNMAHIDEYRHYAFYNTALAIYTQALATKAPPPSTETYPSEYFYTRARFLLGNPLDITRFTVHDVAAMALMGFYLIEMNRRDAACMCVSNAMHISIMHGAHRGWVDERGKRVFWTLYILDRWLSCLMGRPPTIMDDAIRLPLPCDAPDMPPAAGLRAHVELSRISGHIVCNTYRVSPRETMNDPLRHVEKAINMLEQWKSDLPPRMQLFNDVLSDDPACCLLHMGYNQLIILTIRPIFFAAVKKAFAERLVIRQSSLNSHPQLDHIRRCVAAAELNLRLARHILALNHPRKLLQAGLHFIFNAAVCLLLQELVLTTPRESKTLNSDLDFVRARFEEESRIGSNYGRDCANVLQDLRVLVQRLRAPMGLGFGSAPTSGIREVSTNMLAGDPEGLNNPPVWEQRAEPAPVIPQQLLVAQGHVLYDELVSWIDYDWQSHGGYMM